MIITKILSFTLILQYYKRKKSINQISLEKKIFFGVIFLKVLKFFFPLLNVFSLYTNFILAKMNHLLYHKYFIILFIIFAKIFEQ